MYRFYSCWFLLFVFYAQLAYIYFCQHHNFIDWVISEVTYKITFMHLIRHIVRINNDLLWNYNRKSNIFIDGSAGPDTVFSLWISWFIYSPKLCGTICLRPYGVTYSCSLLVTHYPVITKTCWVILMTLAFIVCRITLFGVENYVKFNNPISPS